MNIRRIKLEWTDRLPVFSNGDYLSWLGGDPFWAEGDGSMGGKYLFAGVLRSRLGFRWLIPQCAVSCIHGIGSSEDEAAFVEALPGLLKEEGVDWLGTPPTYCLSSVAPRGAEAVQYGTYLVDLTKAEEELWQGVHSKHRNSIRRATGPVTIREGLEYADAAHTLISETLEKAEIEFLDRSRFGELLKVLSGHVSIHMAFAGEKPQGCAVIPHSRFGAVYRYGGSIDMHLPGAMNLLHWEAMRSMKARGVERYDFAGCRLDPDPGSKQEGLMRFKARFGGQLIKGSLWRMSIRPGRQALFRGLASIAGKESKPDVIDQELIRQAAWQGGRGRRETVAGETLPQPRGNEDSKD